MELPTADVEMCRTSGQMQIRAQEGLFLRVYERWFALGTVAEKGQGGPQHVWVFMSALSGLRSWLFDASCPSLPLVLAIAGMRDSP